MNSTTIAVDVAKSVFEVAVSEQPGLVRERHRLSRARFHRFLAEQPAASVRDQSSYMRAMLAPHSHANQTTGPSTPASSSPHRRWWCRNASRSVSRLTAREPIASRWRPRAAHS
jgi:hypothetical protein